jgi:hypothetical protein
MAEQQARNRLAVALEIGGANHELAQIMRNRPQQNGTHQLHAQRNRVGRIGAVDVAFGADANHVRILQLLGPAPVGVAIVELLHRTRAFALRRAAGLE